VTSHPAIRVSGLSKLYKVGARQQGYKTLRESIADACAAPFARLRGRGTGDGGQGAAKPKAESGKSSSAPDPSPSPSPRLSGEQFWALKDVSFEVQPGEVVGIIGRNGAGKSTLLKILSRITEPTSGRIELRGRVGSLLEVGTGFHPELSGRENIYMNGSILGMSRREIQRKFDEIVDFSGIEDFLDTPVKRYSSGMYVRLAFAVAAHLEPEILIVDEVLAVGDQAFQRKCIDKMQSVASHGRVVLFVSHNLGSLETLCHKGFVLANGQLEFNGSIKEAIQQYINSVDQQTGVSVKDRRDRRGTGAIRFEEAYVTMGPDQPVNSLWMGRPAEFTFVLNEARPNLDIQFTIHDHRSVPVCTLDSFNQSDADEVQASNTPRYVCRIPELPLRAGRYFISARITYNREQQDNLDGLFFFDVESGEYCGRSLRYNSIPGLVCIDHTWTLPC
jgi:lipopolysaccharide transport system ATP-binding protein